MSPAPPLPTTKTVKAQQDSSKNLYLVHHVGQVQGPFELDFVEAMVISGVYAPSVMIQKAGTTSQVAFSQVMRSKSGLINRLAANAVQQERGRAVLTPATRVFMPETGRTASKSLSIEAKFAWGTSIVVGLFFYWLFCCRLCVLFIVGAFCCCCCVARVAVCCSNCCHPKVHGKC